MIIFCVSNSKITKFYPRETYQIISIVKLNFREIWIKTQFPKQQKLPLVKFYSRKSRRKKCPYSEFFLSAFSRICIQSE